MSAPTREAIQVPAEKPKRIVSLDYCADQYVLKLASHDHILALSPHAEDAYSYMRNEAAGLPKVRPTAEDVLALKPDLIVRTYGGGPNATGFFEKAGIPVLQIGWTSTMFGDEAGSIAFELQRVADELGVPEVGAALSDEYQSRLQTLRVTETADTVLYVAQGGVTTGSGTLVDEMFSLAGYQNFETRPGWHDLPLERLTAEQPDLVAAAFFESYADPSNYWSLARHPVLNSVSDEVPSVQIDGAWTSCGTWFILDAVEALIDKRDEL